MKTKQDLEREKILERYKADLDWVTSTPSGRRVLAKLLKHGGLFLSSFVRANAHQGTTEFYEGMRQLALILHGDLQRHCPEQLKLIIGEMNNENQHDSDLF